MAGTVCLIGGTGFVGRHLAGRLVADGWYVRIPTRRRERYRDLLVLPTAQVIQADVFDPAVLRELLNGCAAVINLVGILNESRQSHHNFRDAHVGLPRAIVQACRDSGVERLVHMSALNASSTGATSEYLRSKGEAENAVHQVPASALRVTSFRPSVIFGPEDSFFNRFAALLKVSPVVFPLACPNARFAPVYVGDVVHAFATALTNKATYGQRYNLCGPKTYTLKALVEYTAKVMGLKRFVIGLNDRLSRWQAMMLEHAPGKPFSMDNYHSLQVDSVCEEEFPAVFGIRPATVEAIVPQYLAQRTQRGRYSRLRSRHESS